MADFNISDWLSAGTDWVNNTYNNMAGYEAGDLIDMAYDTTDEIGDIYNNMVDYEAPDFGYEPMALPETDYSAFDTTYLDPNFTNPPVAQDQNWFDSLMGGVRNTASGIGGMLGFGNRQNRVDQLSDDFFRAKEMADNNGLTGGERKAYITSMMAASKSQNRPMSLNTKLALAGLGIGLYQAYAQSKEAKDSRKYQEKMNDPVYQANREIAYRDAMAAGGLDTYGRPLGGTGGGGGGSSSGGGINTGNATNPFLN